MYWWTGILGCLLVVAPFTLGYSGDQTALWSDIVLGAIALLVSLWRPLDKGTSNWEYWTAGAMGILAIVAPWVLGFSAQTTATWTTVILGLVLACLAGYEVFRAKPPADRIKEAR